jgi:hypothetical protein
MKHLVAVILVFALLLSASTGDARNTIHQLSIEEALAEGAAKEVLIDGVALYFGDQATPSVESNHGQFTANRKTNAFNKSDEEACKWVFLSAVKSLQERARREGGNAVINIYSYYYKNKFVSDTQFECGAGAMVAGVTMIGDVVTLAE